MYCLTERWTEAGANLAATEGEMFRGSAEHKTLGAGREQQMGDIQTKM
jgi:hypothetical protein